MLMSAYGRMDVLVLKSYNAVLKFKFGTGFLACESDDRDCMLRGKFRIAGERPGRTEGLFVLGLCKVTKHRS